MVSILVLSLTRDSTWIPIAASGMANPHVEVETMRVSAARHGPRRDRSPWRSLFSMPMSDLLAMMLNDFQPVRDPSWGFVAERYPGRRSSTSLQADGGFVRDGAWYSAAYLIGGLALLFLLGRGRAQSERMTFLKAAAVAGALSVLVIPIFSAFRLELVLRPDGRLRPRPGGRARGRACGRASPGCGCRLRCPGRSRT